MDINNKELLLGHNQLEEDVEEQVANCLRIVYTCAKV